MKNTSNLKLCAVAVCISIISIFIGFFPYFSKAFSVLFFNMDPDPMYVGNALQLVETGKVFFKDHPGTPLISLMAAFYLPIKIYVNTFLHIPDFGVYFFQHLDFMYLYTRLLLLIVLSIGLFLFHYVLLKRYKSILLNIFFGLMLFLDAMHQGMYWGITPEILCFTLTAFWFYFLDKYRETGKIKFIFIASALAGLIFATKMSFLFVVFANFLYLVFEFGTDIKSFFRKGLGILLRAGFLSAVGFMVGIIPLWYKLHEVVNYIFSYFFHTGKMGLGNTGLFDVGVYTNSLLGLFNHPIVLIVFLVFLMLGVKSIKGERLIKSILISSVLGVFVFMKYEVFHYQTANILLLVLAVSTIFNRLSKGYKLLILFTVLIFFADSVKQNFKARSQIVGESDNLQEFIDSKNIGGKIVWEYAKVRDYGAIRSVEWSGFSLLKDFNIALPNTASLDFRNLAKISNFPYNEGYPLNSTCWDLLILQKQTWDNFLRAQEDPMMYIRENIPGTEMVAVTYRNQLNCLPKKNK